MVADLTIARTNAANYLVSHFNPQVGLIQESPHVNPTLYWLAIDNLLALAALNGVPQTVQINNVTHTIGETLAKYNPPPHGRIEILWDQPQPEPFRYGIHWIVNRIGDLTIETETTNWNNPKPFNYQLESDTEAPHIGEPLTYGNYGDILCYAAMNRRLGAKPAPWSLWNPNTWSQPSATELLAQANALWDGTGINDKYRQAQPDQHYAMYKLALNVIANVKFGKQPNPDLIQRLLAVDTTDYLPNGASLGDENTESWSFKLIALNMLSKSY